MIGWRRRWGGVDPPDEADRIVQKIRARLRYQLRAINEPGSILSDEGLCSISIENQVSWLLTDLTFSTEGHCGDLAS